LPNGASPVSGSTKATVWIQTIQPPEFVKRHYEIAPAINPASATAKVTLYFTQAEFNDFNAINALDLPTGTTDASGKSNLLVLLFIVLNKLTTMANLVIHPSLN
jgi:hypothetical protein